MGRFSKNVIYYTFVIGIITYKFHTSLLNAFLLTLLPWWWWHQVSPPECCAMAQAIGSLLSHGPGFEPKPVHAGLVLEKVTLQQDFRVNFFLSLSCHWYSVLAFVYATWSYQLAVMLNKTLFPILFLFLILLILIQCWYIQLGLCSAAPYSIHLPSI